MAALAAGIRDVGRTMRWLGPVLAWGLFAGRVVSEALHPGLAGAAVLTLLATFLAWLLARHRPAAWPGILLLAYIFYPEPNPRVAASVLGVVAATHVLMWPGLHTMAGHSRLKLASLVLVVAGFLALYVDTLAPGVLPADSGEFQLVSASLGVAHPPGFPVYTMLAFLWTKLPLFDSPAARTNLLSAVISAITLVLIHVSTLRLTGSLLAGLVASLALGTATTFWSQATTTNIRSLTALFAALVLYALFRMTDRLTLAGYSPITNRGTGTSERPFLLFVLAVTLGMGHHGSLVFMGAVFFLHFVVVCRSAFKKIRLWPALAAMGLAGLLPLLYLPWRAAAGARGAPDNLSSLAGLLNHALALGFRGDLFYFIAPEDLWERMKVMASVLTFQFHPLLLGGALLGLLVLLRRNRALALLLAGSFAVHTLVTATYRAPQTVEYMMPAYVPLALLLGCGSGFLIQAQRGPAWGWKGQAVDEPIRKVVLSILIVAAVSQAIDRLPSFVALHKSNDTRDTVGAFLEQAPEGGVILADWHWATPLWYLQDLEGIRTDVMVEFVFPTAEPYTETWARRIEEELSGGRAVVATHYDQSAYERLPAAEPLGEAFLFTRELRQTLPDGFSPLDVRFGDLFHVVGFRASPAQVEIGAESVVTLAWRNGGDELSGTSLFVHLVGEDGQLYAQDDVPVLASAAGINLTQFRLTPRPGSMPGEYELMAGAYGTESISDQDGQFRTPIGRLSLSAMSRPPVTQNNQFRTAADGPEFRRLVGYDWDLTLPGRRRLYLHWETDEGYVSEVVDSSDGGYTLPESYGPWGIRAAPLLTPPEGAAHYVPFAQDITWLGRATSDLQLSGPETVVLPQWFRSGRPVNRDLVVSVRLVGFEEDGFHWNWSDLDDSVPAMGAIPTLKWIGGSTIRDPHRLSVSERATSGQSLGVLLSLYDAFTGREVRILDEGITELAPWVPLGRSSYEGS